jgi:hypothetical protein
LILGALSALALDDVQKPAEGFYRRVNKLLEALLIPDAVAGEFGLGAVVPPVADLAFDFDDALAVSRQLFKEALELVEGLVIR